MSTAGAILQIPCQLGSTTTVVGATICVALPILNIDNSDAGTGYDAATDGVLLLRYLFGLRGTALVDGDGQTLAMPDDLMILRRRLNPGTATSNAAAMSAITANAKRGSRTDLEVVNAIDALKP